MKKVALVFVLVVFVPSLVLAWLAVRSLRDQQFLLEKQRSLLYQGVTDALAKQIQDALAEEQRLFTQKVSALLRDRPARALAPSFNARLRKEWPLAQVGFAVTTEGELLSPSAETSPDARAFKSDHAGFLANREAAEVYLNYNNRQTQNSWSEKIPANSSLSILNAGRDGDRLVQADGSVQNQALAADANATANRPEYRKVVPQQNATFLQNPLSLNDTAEPQIRAPVPLSQKALAAEPLAQSAPDRSRSKAPSGPVQEPAPRKEIASAPGAALNAPATGSLPQPVSKVAASATEFRQLIGEDSEGTLARFVDNKLNVLVWCRPTTDPRIVFGAQLSLPRLVEELRPLLQRLDPRLEPEICLALLDDMAKPLTLSRANYHGSWKRPFVATEIGEVLPHWEVAAYLLDPAKLTQSARAVKLTLSLVIAVLVLAIGIGSWLIVSDLNRQLTLARQKTDFVSNVSHELKTPLTSIRMFAELLAEGRVNDPARQRAYLGIITAEAARLTRLINNVLDFARLERGEKKYQFQPCDLVAVVRETAAAYRPHLETHGFKFECALPEEPLPINGDRDALAQVLVNLLSNAEKYSESRKEISVQILRQTTPLPHAEVRLLDRGPGVPKGSREKIFEQFYRAHDALNSGIQGSGLGLTLARQIARAHGGEVAYEPREGGGSCFTLRLPTTPP